MQLHEPLEALACWKTAKSLQPHSQAAALRLPEAYRNAVALREKPGDLNAVSQLLEEAGAQGIDIFSKPE